MLPVPARNHGGVLFGKTALFHRGRSDDDRAEGLDRIAMFDREEVAVLAALTRVSVPGAVEEELEHQHGADDSCANGDSPENRTVRSHVGE